MHICEPNFTARTYRSRNRILEQTPKLVPLRLSPHPYNLSQQKWKGVQKSVRFKPTTKKGTFKNPHRRSSPWPRLRPRAASCRSKAMHGTLQRSLPTYGRAPLQPFGRVFLFGKPLLVGFKKKLKRNQPFLGVPEENQIPIWTPSHGSRRKQVVSILCQ